MKKKPHPLKILFWLVVVAAAVFLIVMPPKAHHRPPHTVQVEQPPDISAPPVLPPEAPSGEEHGAMPPETIVPPPEQQPLPPHHGPSKIAIVIDDVGLDVAGSRRAVALPAAITLSYIPYANHLPEQTRLAHNAGHELLLHMPMQPMGSADPGPGALSVELPPDELRQRLDTALASFTGYDGMNNHMGSKFTADRAAMDLVMADLLPRHIFFLDSRTSAQSVGYAVAREHGIPAISRDVFLDDDMSAKAVRAQLEATERVARHKGFAVAIGHPHAVTLQALEEWIPDAEKRGFVLVPINSLVNQAK